MMKRTTIAVIVFASQATLAIAQSTQTTARQVVNPEDSGYLGAWVQLDPVAAAPRAVLTSPIAAGHRFAGPEDSGYLGGWGQDDASRAQAAISPRAPATPAIAIERSNVNPEDSGYRGPGV
ncbi:MAG: hypothetical protein HY661_12205 [Betaproteobacteria bacterium]|nr:hypothetical protein [Betaproteobacteria bacterium]